MTPRIHVRSGSLAGRSLDLDESPLTLGRDPGCTVVFDPYADREVSARHAALVRDGDGWLVRDLGSLNGTWVDGRRIGGDTRLTGPCRVRLGASGPEIDVEIPVSADAGGGDGGPGGARPQGGSLAPPSTVVSTLLRERRTLRLVAAVLGVSVVGLLAGLLVRNARERAAWAGEREALLARIDSVLAATDLQVRSLEGYTMELADTLQRSRAEIRRLQDEIASHPLETAGESAELERRLQAAAAEIGRLRLAASIDWQAVEDGTVPGVARVFVETAAGDIEAGTAFLVRDDGTFVTAGHLVAGRDGQREIRRLAVQLSGTTLLVDATTIAVSAEDDLALIRADGLDPGVAPIAFNARPDTISSGQPVALVGFPLGGAPTGGAALPLRSAGILRASESGRIEVEGISERGGSGSPLTDAAGAVIGLLRGAVEREGTRLLVAVPSPVILALLQR